MSDESLLPEFHVRLAFVDKEGDEIPPDELKLLDKPENGRMGFFQQWADGEIRRDVVVELGHGITHADFHGDLVNRLLGSQEDQEAVVNRFADVLCRLLNDLRLATYLLAHKEIKETEPFKLNLKDPQSFDLPTNWDGAVVSGERGVQGMVRPGAVYPCSYPNDSESTGTFSFKELTQCTDIVGFLRKYFRDVLSKLLEKDNSVVLQLLQTAVNSRDDYPIAVTAFTPVSFATCRDDIWKWALPMPTLVTSAEVLAKIDDDEWLQWFSPCVKLDRLISTGDAGRLADVMVLCTGSKHDLVKTGGLENVVLFCSSPSTLGVRGGAWELSGHVVNHHVLGDDRTGFYFCEMISTCILNSRGVAQLTISE